MGETYDARLERPGWSATGYDDKDWASVRIVEPEKRAVIAPAGPPVRKIEEVRPVKILKTPAGETVFDMGQNMVGHVRLKVRGPAGTTVTLRHAEVLDKAGNFYTANLRAAKQQVTYVLKGGGDEVYEPHFTFQGFRYVAVEGWPGEPTLDGLTGIVVHSDMPVTGQFTTSNPMLNQLQHNIRWGQKGNFVDVPTDCPQRDERLGWTGDAQVFSRTAAFNMDVAGFFTKWLGDVAADQNAKGSVPFVVPDVLSHGGRSSSGGSAAWADVATIIPWNMYLSYGDTRLLERQYPSMKAWVEYMRHEAGDKDLWTTGFHFGDWLAFATTASDYPGATTGKDLIATAFYAHSTDLVQRAAAVLGKKDDAAEYAALLPRIKEAFRKEFVTASGRVGENTQTAYAARAPVRPAARGAARGGGAPPRRRGEDPRSPDDGLRRHAVPVPRAQPLRLHGRRLHAAQPPGVPVVALPGEAGRDDHLGALGRPQARRQLPGRGDELVQPLRLRRDRRVDVPGGRRPRDRPAGARLQARARPAAARRRPHVGRGAARDALRRGRLRLGAGRRQADRLGHRATQHARHDPPARGDGGRGDARAEAPVAAAPGVKRAAQEGDDVVVEAGSGRYQFVYDAARLVARLQRPGRLSTRSPIEDLLASPQARAVLDRRLAGFTTDPRVQQALKMSLREVAPYEPAIFTEEMLKVLDDELRAIPD